MTPFIQEYEVKKGRTVTCIMGTAHAGAKLTLANFSGEDNEEKQKKIDKIVALGSLEKLPLTKDQEKALAEFKEAEELRLKKEAEVGEEAEERKNAILEADFDDMNKDPMIEFAKDHGIDLKATLADEIREELKELQESLTAPE